jgi:3-dehydroquinate dehydratase-1
MIKTVQLGDLTLGEVPRVVGTLSTLAGLQGFLQLKGKSCDIAEARVDLLGPDSDWLRYCIEIGAAGTPVLLTIRLAAEGGGWTRSEAERLKLIETALPHVAVIDVELRSELSRTVLEPARRAGTPVLVSYHDFERTPPLDELRGVVSEAHHRGSIAKVATMVRSQADLVTLRGLLDGDWDQPVCVIGMGSLGTRTRTEFPLLGSCLTYGYVDDANTPGQLPAQSLVEHLSSALPGYTLQTTAQKQVPHCVF